MCHNVHLVEDDEDDYFLIKEALDTYPDLFQVTWLKTYEEALGSWQTGFPDVCLIDYRLGSYTGFELIEKAIGLGVNSPIILMTGASSQFKLDEKALVLGADDYISKHEFSPGILKRMLLFNIQRKEIENKYRMGENELRQMHEISSSTLHNIGNVLNSLGVGLQHLKRRIDEINCPRLDDVANILKGDEHVMEDTKLRLIPNYLKSASSDLRIEQAELFDSVGKCLESVKIASDAIMIQQKTARSRDSEDIDLLSIVEEALMLYRSKIVQKKIAIEVNVEDISLQFSRSTLLHVMINLVKNAIEALHTTEKRKIAIFTETIDQSLHLIIEDNGCGIDGETLETLFTYGVTTKQHGNGLGLHFCQKVLTSEGCAIKAKSPGVGQGATFTIELPLALVTVEQ